MEALGAAETCGGAVVHLSLILSPSTHSCDEPYLSSLSGGSSNGNGGEGCQVPSKRAVLGEVQEIEVLRDAA
jgi:hypothetical protein